jgi:hypothetical protein
MELWRWYKVLEFLVELWRLLPVLQRTRHQMTKLRLMVGSMIAAVGLMSMTPRINDVPTRTKASGIVVYRR